MPYSPLCRYKDKYRVPKVFISQMCGHYAWYSPMAIRVRYITNLARYKVLSTFSIILNSASLDRITPCLDIANKRAKFAGMATNGEGYTREDWIRIRLNNQDIMFGPKPPGISSYVVISPKTSNFKIFYDLPQLGSKNFHIFSHA
jgi:hypothetical protein